MWAHMFTSRESRLEFTTQFQLLGPFLPYAWTSIKYLIKDYSTACTLYTYRARGLRLARLSKVECNMYIPPFA